jgi:hypothetical protein
MVPQKHNVSLSVNVCRTDAAFLDKTLRHITRALNYPFAERIVAYDPGSVEGRFRGRGEEDNAKLCKMLAGLLSDGIIDRVDEIPWAEDQVHAVIAKYFGDKHVKLKDFSGAPVYQYLFAIDRCSANYVLHVDSDMLFHCASSRPWIDLAIERMQQDSRLAIAVPRAGPPQAQNWLERVCGRPLFRSLNTGWHRSETVSTRYFLLDSNRFQKCLLPLVQKNPGEALEDTLTNTLNARGFEIWSLRDLDNWAVHPFEHDANFITHLDDLIWGVEEGLYPFVRDGRYWDIITAGKSVETWLNAIRRARRRRASEQTTNPARRRGGGSATERRILETNDKDLPH